MKLLIIFFGLLLSIWISCIDSLESFASATVSTGNIKGYVIEPSVNRTNAVNIFKVSNKFWQSQNVFQKLFPAVSFWFDFKKFQGIPFAEPPVGNLRFALPQPIHPWKGAWNATFYKPACPSNTTATTSPQNVTHEDCLYLNVFADQACKVWYCKFHHWLINI